MNVANYGNQLMFQRNVDLGMPHQGMFKVLLKVLMNYACLII